MKPTAMRFAAATLFLTLLCGAPAHADPASPAGLDENSLGLVGDKGIAPPVPPTVDAAAAALYCRRMEVNARSYARWSTDWAWVFGVAAAGAVARTASRVSRNYVALMARQRSRRRSVFACRES